jgi:TPP-dependent pyruvate/acetoin dehydrogenase alpha subunit
MGMETKKVDKSFPLPSDEIIADYRLVFRSRQASIVGRREVLSGKAKFGIFGDCQELPQIAMARPFRKGDWRSGYYRNHTWFHALGILPFREFFAHSLLLPTWKLNSQQPVAQWSAILSPDSSPLMAPGKTRPN